MKLVSSLHICTMADREAQNIRIQFTASQEEIELVTGLFRQQRWPLTEVDLADLPDHMEQLYTWTMDVNESQRDSVISMVAANVTTLFEHHEADQGPIPQRRALVLNLSGEQEEQLRRFMQDQEWEADEIIQGEAMPVEDNDDAGDLPQMNQPRFIIIQRDGDFAECQECFAQPCVTNNVNRQEWWRAEPAEQSPHNNGARRALYFKFWNMCYNRGLWGEERYVEKKRQMEGANIRREIMPDCICRLVRSWYPNPPGVPYMGHKNQ